MQTWYYIQNGQRIGPVTESMLRQEIRVGRVSPGDFVWTESMADWTAAQTAMPDAFAAGASYPEPPGPMVGYARHYGGTGGQTPNGELMRRAREHLRGTWGTAIGGAVILALLYLAMGTVPYLGGLAQLILTGPLNLGVAIFFLAFARPGQPRVGLLFDGFQRFGTAWLANFLAGFLGLLAALPMGLGALLTAGLISAGLFDPPTDPAGIFVMVIGFGCIYVALLMPSIYVGMGLRMTMFIVHDKPDLGAWEAIKRSWDLMSHSKNKLLGLYARFLGWGLLCILTLGIGFLWLWPYMQTSVAAFYEDLQQPLQQQAGYSGAQPLGAEAIGPTL